MIEQFDYLGILHEFNLEAEDPDNLPPDDYEMGATILPKPFKIVLKHRIQ